MLLELSIRTTSSEADMATTKKSRTTATPSSKSTAAAKKPRRATSTAKAVGAASKATKTQAATTPEAHTEHSVPTATSGEAEREVRRGDLIEELTAKTGMRRADVKDFLEATLQTLAQHLEAEDTLQVPPLGRIKVVRNRSTEGGSVVTCKVRMKSDRASSTSRSQLASATPAS